MKDTTDTQRDLFEALHEAYVEACERGEYGICDLLRLETTRVVSGRRLLIPCEEELGDMTPDLFADC